MRSTLPLLAALMTAAWTTPSVASKGPPAGFLKPNKVVVVKDDQGQKLQVDGRDFMVLGMNWGYIPIGHNYRYALFSKPDDFIKKVLDYEMTLVKKMGVNTIRQYDTIPPRWVTYIYEKYGIFTAINHTTGRWGMLVDGAWTAPIDYSDKRHRAAVVKSVEDMVRKYRGVPGILMYLLGNENNYGLEWKSAEIEALPAGERHKAKAVFLYSLWGETVAAIKKLDPHHPTAIVNGDLQYLSLIAKHTLPAGLDILGTNVYRGPSATDLFARVKKELGIPVMFAEFGADAYNAKEDREDHIAQAGYLRAQWQEVYEMSYGKGRVGNAIGGMTFQWSDGWWKTGQTTNLDVQDTTATWPNGGYPHDFVEGKNNMNEEWLGVCAKGPVEADGTFKLYPRSAYYVLQQGYQLDPYAAGTDLTKIRSHWKAIKAETYAPTYENRLSQSRIKALERIRLTEARLEMTTFWTGGSRLEDKEREAERFDHMQNLYLGVGIQPVTNLEAKFTLSILGNVPNNPIDEIFYENRGTKRVFDDASGTERVIGDLERLKLHAASFTWKHDWFELEGFYREGHYHWGYEGDFFGLFPEAYYGPSIDLYNSDAPIGVIFTGKKALDGLVLAIGPQLWWGANPAFLAKYTRSFGDYRLTLIHQEDLAEQTGTISSSVATPEQKTRKTTVALDMNFGEVKLSIGAMTSGSSKLGQNFFIPRDAPAGQGYAGSDHHIAQDQVEFVDTLAAKAKLTYQAGVVNFYMQGAYKGLVADGGADATKTFTGWTLKEDGRGNHWNALMGLALNLGFFQVAPNVLYQRPLVGPMPFIEGRFNPKNGAYFPGMRGRNILDDPFVVLGNREQIGAELLLAYDPTPDTWMWAWDNEIVEDADFAMSIDFVYRHLPTIRDGNVGRLADGTAFGFITSPPALDLWEINTRIISNPADNFKLAANLLIGNGQANGDDPREIQRVALTSRIVWHQLAADLAVKINDWGPYDYHRDFNFTFPLQLMGDISWAAKMPKWLGQFYTRFGVRGTMRWLDENSNRYKADPSAPDAWGNEWELRAYIHLMM